MSILTGVFKNGSILLDHPPAEWTDGERVTVRALPWNEVVGMTEEEQGNDPESIEQWIAEFNAIPTLEMSKEEEAEITAWRRKVKEHNLEAVRRQFEEGIPGVPQ
jgi:hypothetical protein